MKVLVLGSGAREHALLLALARDPAVSGLVCAPGNAGTATLADNRPVDPSDGAAVVALVCELGRTSPSTCRYWRSIGYGPKGIKVGRRVLYAECEVDAWLERLQAEAGA